MTFVLLCDVHVMCMVATKHPSRCMVMCSLVSRPIPSFSTLKNMPGLGMRLDAIILVEQGIKLACPEFAIIIE